MTDLAPHLPHDRPNSFHSARASIYLNFATYLNISSDLAYDFAFFSIDDFADEPQTARDDATILTALAYSSYSSDDDFDDFTHELRHMLDDCLEHDHCCTCDECNPTTL